MDGSAPKEIIQSVDRQEQEMQAKVAEHTTQAGHPVTIKEVNPNDTSPLDAITETVGNIIHDVGTRAKILLHGEGPEDYIGGTSGSKPSSILRFKGRNLKKFFERNKKAA